MPHHPLPLSPQLSRLQQHANVLLLERFSGEHLSLSGQERRTLVRRLLQEYKEGIRLGGWCGGGGGEGVQGCGVMRWVVGCGE